MNANTVRVRPGIRTLALAGALVLAAGTAQGAIIYLKEGGSLEGTLVSSTDTEVVLDTSQGRVRVEMNRVRNIDYAQGGAPAPAAPAVQPAPPVQVEPPPAEYRVYRRRRYVAADEPLFAPHRQVLSFDFGLASPLTSISGAGGGSINDGDVGPAVGVQYLYYASPRVAWGLEYHYYDRGEADSTDFLPNLYSRAYGDTSLLLGVMKYSLTSRGPMRPFLLLGVGGYHNSRTIEAHPVGGYAWSDTQTNETRTLVDDTADGLAASVRLGLDFGFLDPSVFSLEAGWTGLTSANYHATGEGEALGVSGVSGALNYFTFTGRWGFSF